MEISPESGSNLTPRYQPGTNPWYQPKSLQKLVRYQGYQPARTPVCARSHQPTISYMENRLVPLVPLVPNKGFCGENGTNPPVPTPLGGTNVGTQTPKFQPQGLRHIGDILPGVLKRLRKQATP